MRKEPMKVQAAVKMRLLPCGGNGAVGWSLVSPAEPAGKAAAMAKRTTRILSWGCAVALVWSAAPRSAFAAGNLSIQFNAAPNLIVDSNVCSPSTYAPEIATMGVGFCNYGDAPLTDVVANIGTYATRTPGIYPTRNSATAAADLAVTSSCLADSGLYSLTHLGDAVDATRYVGTLDVGQCSWQYWSFSYPKRRSNDSGCNPAWCLSNTPDDDLWLEFDSWATSAEGPVANGTWRVNMRNEISAAANKIFPNGASWFNVPTECYPGQTVTTNGINYSLGNVGHGFDNDGNGTPDYNAFLQPIGDANWNPACFRLVHTAGQLQINRSSAPTQYLDFVNQLYFTNLPSDNTAVDGVVYYTFMCLDGACAVPLTPYQEAASGFDNEKFAGDYGAQTATLISNEPESTLTKTVSDAGGLAAGRAEASETLTYAMSLSNDSPVAMGRPDLGMPVVIRDRIPAGTRFVGGSATSSFACCGVTTLYSIDNGVSWSSAQPSNPQLVTDLQWRLQAPFPIGANGTVGFQVTVNNPYTGDPVILNTAAASLGDASPFDEATAGIPFYGTSHIGNEVFGDDGAGGGTSNDGLRNGGEALLAGIGLSLYWDQDGDGVLDAGEFLVAQTTSGGSASACGAVATGNYCFANVAAGSYLVIVDRNDPDLPTGFRLTAASPAQPSALRSVLNLAAGATHQAADYGFGPSLRVTKARTSAATSTEGQLVTYDLAVTNLRPTTANCAYTFWAERALGTSGFIDAANAASPQPPDAIYARGGEAGSGDDLDVDVFGAAGTPGTITTVELLIPLYLSNLVIDDDLEWTVRDGSGQTLTGTFTPSQLNAAAPSEADLTVFNVNVSSIFSSFTEIANASVSLNYKHTGAPDGALMFVDGVGLRVVTNQMCGAPSDNLMTVPLVDSYDADLLQFVDATVAPVGVSVTGTAPNRIGTLTWALGPLSAGQTRTVTVRFLATEQDSNGNNEADSLLQPHTNTAAVTNAQFFDGGFANNASAQASHTVLPTGTISGYVYNDNAGGTPNGARGGGEGGIPFVTVRLTQCGAGSCTSGDEVFTTTTTDAAGFYRFTNLPEDDYLVEVLTASLPGAAPVQTGDPDEAGVCVTCDHRTTTSRLVDLENGNPADDDLTFDFGYTIGNVVFGTIWEDNDGDGVRDPGEGPIAGVTVTVAGDGSGVTDSLGRYRIVDVPDGTRAVTVTTGSGPLVGYAQTGDPDVPGAFCNASCDNQKAAVSITGGNLYGAYDFGYRRTGSSVIGDTLYADWDGDGTQDTGEEGIAGVTIRLFEDANGDGVRDCGPDTICDNADDVDGLRAETSTNSTGNYSFTALPSGSWIVVVDQTDPQFTGAYTSLRPTQDPDEAGVCTVCNGRGSVTTTGASTHNNIDFGYQPIGFGSIGDQVWNDADSNGALDGTEVGLANVTVRLYEDTNGNGVYDSAADALVATTTSDGAGLYTFYNLPVRSYLVDVDANDGQIPLDAMGRRYVLTSAADPLAVNLGANQAYVDADFGFGPGGSIGDRVFQDNDGNGNQGGTEAGINGVTVRLYRDVNADGDYDAGTDTLVATTTTATVNGFSGSYSFNFVDVNGNGVYDAATETGIPAGRYVVVVNNGTVPIAGGTWTADPDSTLNGQSGFNLAAGQNIVFADFGVRPPNTIGDLVWNDLDGDGVFDTGVEFGLAGVQVTLYARGCNPTCSGGFAQVATTTTDVDGLYTFGNQPNNQEYLVLVTTPVGYFQTGDPDVPGAPCAASCDGQTVVSGANGAGPAGTAFSGADYSNDFGYQQRANLEIDKDTSTATVNAGGQATYTILLRNVGGTTATNVVVTDTLPSGFSHASTMVAQDPGVSRSPTTNPGVGATSLSWGTWSIPAGADVTITFVVNVASGTASGTYDNTAAATYNNGAANVAVDDAGTVAQDAGTPTSLDPEDDEDIIIPSPSLTILKSSAIQNDGGTLGLVDPGETLRYTITVTNAGTATLTNVSVSDAVPTGTTYVASSSIITRPADQITTYSDNFDNGSGGTDYPTGSDGTAWGANWNNVGTAMVDGGDYSLRIGRGQNPSRAVTFASGFYAGTLRFAFRRVALEDTDDVTVSFGGTTLTTISGDGLSGSLCSPNPGGSINEQTDAAYISVACSIPTGLLTAGTRTLLFTESNFANTNSEFLFIDDVAIEGATRVTLSNQPNAAPPTLLAAGAGQTLRPSESMTLRFDVTANNPLPIGMTRIENTAYSQSVQTPTPVSSTVQNDVVLAANGSIEGFVWDDNSPAPNGDGIMGGGEPRLGNVRVELWSDPNGDGNPADGVRLLTDLSDASGATPGRYLFSALPAGNYVVVVATSTLPVSYSQTGDPDQLNVLCTTCDSRTAVAHSGTGLIGPRNFGYRYNATPLPVTLSSFSAQPGGAGLVFDWTTDTETRNVGFYLFALGEEGWVPLHDDLIPSQRVDSVERLAYHYETAYVDAESFLLVDIDTEGIERVHGPFGLGDSEVSTAPAVEGVPWKTIVKEHKTKEEKRQGGWKKQDYPIVRLAVAKTGLYRVTYEALKAAGIDMLKVPLNQLAVLDGSRPVPAYVEGNGTFGPGDAVEFYAVARPTLYTDTSAYTLRLDKQAALRASEDKTDPSRRGTPVTVYLETARVEKQKEYNAAAPSSDPWYERRILANRAPASATFAIPVSDLVLNGWTSQLAVNLWGITSSKTLNPDHHTQAQLNGQAVGELWFDGPEAATLTAEIDTALLIEGNNELVLRLPLDTGAATEVQGVDAYALTYPRRLVARDGQLAFRGASAGAFTVSNLPSAQVSVYRIRDSGAVERLTKTVVTAAGTTWSVTFAGTSEAAQYVVAASTAKSSAVIAAAPPAEDILAGPTEYLVIAHGDFVDGVAPLVERRRQQGLTAQVVDVQQIYEQLSGGLVDAAAIRTFVGRAAAQKGTRYVLLVGGDTYDYKNYLGSGGMSFIPSLYVATAPQARYVPADPLYGDVDSDWVPDVAVGRLPVRTGAELQAAVNKTLAYENKSRDAGDTTFFRNVLAASDGYDGAQRLSFATIGRDLLANLPGWTVHDGAIETLGLVTARTKVFDTLSSGVAFAQFFGHSSYNVWSFSSLLTASGTRSAKTLTNVGRPFVVAQWGCWNTYYVHPTINTMGHAFMLSGDQGAAAVLGASALTDSTSDLALGREFLPLVAQPGKTLGDALVEAKRRLAVSNPQMVDVLAGWILLGDPALALEPAD